MQMSENFRGWLLSAAIAVLGTLLLFDSGNMQLTAYWFITFFAIALFAFEPMPNMITAVMLMLAFIVAGIAPSDLVMAGWTTFIPWIMFAGLAIGVIIDKSGIANRIALIIISKLATTPLRLFLSFLVGGYVLNLIIPDGFTATIVMATFGVGVCRSLKLEKDSKAASALMMASYFAGMSVGFNFLPNGLGIIGLQMVKSLNVPFTWAGFFYENFVLIFVMTLLSMFIAYFYSRREIGPLVDACRSHAEQELRALGSVTATEWRSLTLLVLAVLAYVLEPWHGLSGPFTMALIILLAFTPLFGLLDKDDIPRMPLGIPFFMTGCMAIGMVAGSLGIPAMLSEKLVPLLANFTSTAGASMFAYVTGVIANFILTPVAASTALSLPLGELAMQLGLSVKPMLYSFFVGLDQYLFPYELAPAIYIYATGYVKLKHLVIIMALRMLLMIPVVGLNAAIVWGAMGL